MGHKDAREVHCGASARHGGGRTDSKAVEDNTRATNLSVLRILADLTGHNKEGVLAVSHAEVIGGGDEVDAMWNEAMPANVLL